MLFCMFHFMEQTVYISSNFMRISPKVVNRYKPQPVLSRTRQKFYMSGSSPYDDDSTHYKYVQGVSVGYTLHPKMYVGRPPKKETTHKIKPMRRRRRKAQLPQHHLFEEGDGAVNFQWERELPPFPETESTFSLDLFNKDLEKVKAGTFRQMVETFARGYTKLQQSSIHVPQDVIDENDRAFLRPLVDKLNDEHGPSMSFRLEDGQRIVSWDDMDYFFYDITWAISLYPSEDYPNDKRLYRIIHTEKQPGESLIDFVQRRAKELEPLLEIPKSIRLAAAKEMEDHYLSHRESYSVALVKLGLVAPINWWPKSITST